MPDVSVTWLGHASFRLDSPEGKRIYIDPWLDNPKCPDAEKEPERCDAIAITHGHSDHVGSTVDLSKKFGPLPIVAMVELKAWLKDKGAQTDDMPGPNKGGAVEAALASAGALELLRLDPELGRVDAQPSARLAASGALRSSRWIRASICW